jgi:glucose/arabinose dehydrogenase
MMMRAVLTAVCLVPAWAQASAQVTLTDAFPSLPAFSRPIECVSPGDGTGRLFVVEQRGKIWVFDAAASSPQRRLFLDLTDMVSTTGSETGLLGLAFHPQYAANGQFFVDYTSSSSGSLKSYIARYMVSPANPDSAVKTSETVFLSVDQPYENHNGGKIAFGPDGHLYISLGDGGSGNDPQNNGQSLATVLGKILRIDVNSSTLPYNYSIPPANPFATNSQGYRKEIFAFGLRNPWKFSFDAVTGTLWAGDVGQGAREEIDTIVGGGNYGWRLMEGKICTPNVNPDCRDTAGTILPLWDYGRSAGDVSVTGGYVYRGNAIPSLRGRYIYADYASGRIWALTLNEAQPPTNALLLDSPHTISSFAQDRDREIYAVAYGTGRLYRITGPATDTGSSESPLRFSLSESFPNPFNPSTTIRYEVPVTSAIRLSVFDLLGHEVRVLVDSTVHAGSHEATLDATGLASGMYLYRLRAGTFEQTRKTVLLR